MKLYTKIILTCFVCLLTGCSKDSSDDYYMGNVERPSWTTNSNYDYSSSMTAIVRVELIQTFPDNGDIFVYGEGDLLAAFVDDECVGVASMVDGLYFLYMALPDNYNSSANIVINLHYYNASLKRIFLSESSLEYQSDACIGTADNPMTLSFELL